MIYSEQTCWYLKRVSTIILGSSLKSLYISEIVLLLQEFEIDKANDIKGPADVEKMGIKAYNDKCRAIVMRYAEDWKVRWAYHWHTESPVYLDYDILAPCRKGVPLLLLRN